MITCSCGKPIEKVPDWFQNVKTEFVCNNCPNRKPKASAFMTASDEPALPNMSRGDVPAEIDLEDEFGDES